MSPDISLNFGSNLNRKFNMILFDRIKQYFQMNSKTKKSESKKMGRKGGEHIVKTFFVLIILRIFFLFLFVCCKEKN